MRNTKGQLQIIISLILFVVVIAIAAVVSPVIGSFMDAAIISQNATGTSLILMQAVVPVFWIGIILIFLMMISGRQQQQY
jgi:ABC-type dipeptide/oligopeptide/nickel transport system permease component